MHRLSPGPAEAAGSVTTNSLEFTALIAEVFVNAMRRRDSPVRAAGIR